MTTEHRNPVKHPDHTRTPGSKARSIELRRIRATKFQTGGAL